MYTEIKQQKNKPINEHEYSKVGQIYYQGVLPYRYQENFRPLSNLDFTEKCTSDLAFRN